MAEHVDFENAVRMHNQRDSLHKMDSEQAARVAADAERETHNGLQRQASINDAMAAADAEQKDRIAKDKQIAKVHEQARAIHQAGAANAMDAEQERLVSENGTAPKPVPEANLHTAILEQASDVAEKVARRASLSAATKAFDDEQAHAVEQEMLAEHEAAITRDQESKDAKAQEELERARRVQMGKDVDAVQEKVRAVVRRSSINAMDAEQAERIAAGGATPKKTAHAEAIKAHVDN